MTQSGFQAARNIFVVEIGKCIECGACLHSCPVYRESFDEKYSSRGRNYLMRQLGYDESKLTSGEHQGIFEKCLLCGRCVSGCPRGVRNDLVVLEARAQIMMREGLSLSKAITFKKVMASRESMGRALRLASKLQWILPKTRQQCLAEEHKVLRHLPLYFLGLGEGMHLPSISSRFLSDMLPELNPPARQVSGRRLRAAFFSGCMTEYVLPNVGSSIVNLLNQQGVEVCFPKEQACCGIAAAANGEVKTARELALRNLKALSATGADLIITGCATCGSTLKEGWISLFQDDSRRCEFEKLAAKVQDISEVLIDLAEFKALKYRSKLPAGLHVTYHDPCHLAGYQAVVAQPRRILRKAFGDKFVEMDHKGCCGCGGSFLLHSRDLSDKIGREKIESIKRTGADVVVNTCPGCMVQLVNGLTKYGLPQQVLHLAEVVEYIDDNWEADGER